MPFDVIPLAFQPSQRATGTTDQRAVNVLYEPILNPIVKTIKSEVTKRPGMLNNTQPSGGSATGRGCYAWAATGAVYSVAANKIYSGVTDLGVTLAASTGRVWFAETPATASARLLIVSDGTDNYNITTGDVATQIDESDDAQYPSANNGPITYIDGYLVQTTASALVNGALNGFTAWLAADTLPMDTYGDAVEAHHRQSNQIMVFGKNSIEFFYNRGNKTGSPFQRVAQNAKDFGIATKNSLAWAGEVAFFVAENASRGDGTRTIFMVTGVIGMKEISTLPLNKLLAAEGSSMSSCTSWAERINGQMVYCLNLSSANRSFLYSVDTNMWVEWQAAGGGKFPGISATSLNGVVYIQDAANGRIYTASSTTYQDSAVQFSTIMQTDGRDQGTSNWKTANFVEYIADTQASGTALLEKSDDDGTSFQTVGSFNMAVERKRIYRCGAYRGKRMWRVTDSNNTAGRAQALRVAYRMGQS